MEGAKLCIDIGGTKTIFALINQNSIIKGKRIDTEQSKNDFLRNIKSGINEYLPLSNGIINISIAGRVNTKGEVIYCPNLPLLKFNFLDFLHNFSDKVNIENDGNCFGLYSLHTGRFKGSESGLAIVWGTGIGSSIIYKNGIYNGGGLAVESGHIIADYKTGRSIESLIGGKAVRKRYNKSGLEMHTLAEKGDEKTLSEFKEIGRMFGYYLLSLSFVADPEIIIIGGSFANSWKFIKNEVYAILKENSIRKHLKIKIAKGKFYVVKGAYFIDEQKSFDNKLQGV